MHFAREILYDFAVMKHNTYFLFSSDTLIRFQLFTLRTLANMVAFLKGDFINMDELAHIMDSLRESIPEFMDQS